MLDPVSGELAAVNLDGTVADDGLPNPPATVTTTNAATLYRLKNQ
mgnify:CR=1 FL=1